MDALKALKKALKKKVIDEFKDGDVIKFTSGGKYTYVVLKAGGRWWITGVYDFFGVGRVFDFEKLLEILSDGNVTDIQVASDWVSI